jgi:hypothetical protein
MALSEIQKKKAEKLYAEGGIDGIWANVSGYLKKNPNDQTMATLLSVMDYAVEVTQNPPIKEKVIAPIAPTPPIKHEPAVVYNAPAEKLDYGVIECPACAEEIKASSRFCEFCGTPISDVVPQKTVDRDSEKSPKTSSISSHELLKKVREFDENYEGKKSKNVMVLDGIPKDALDHAISKYCPNYSYDETPLVLVNNKRIINFGFTGILLTDRHIYISKLKNSFFTSLLPIATSRRFRLNEVKSLQVGKHDHCYGTAYIGHQLLLNNQDIGLVRMGTGTFRDDECLEYLAALFMEIP